MVYIVILKIYFFEKFLRHEINLVRKSFLINNIFDNYLLVLKIKELIL